jgi:hypothetical protein
VLTTCYGFVGKACGEDVHRLDLQVIILDVGCMQKFEQYVVYANILH